jgi:hypothetical protein
MSNVRCNDLEAIMGIYDLDDGHRANEEEDDWCRHRHVEFVTNSLVVACRESINCP